MTQPPTLQYQPSVAGRIGRSVLPLARRVLSRRAYNKAYGLLYDAYRQILRVSYTLQVWRTRLSSDPSRRLRAELTLRLLPHTMGGRKALENAFDIAAAAERARVSGAIVECGVARGGTAAMMALTNCTLGAQPRHYWLFDSFEGLPEPTAQDYQDGKTGEHIRPLPKGSCLGTEEHVSRLMFEDLKLDRSRCTLVKGWFQDSVPATKSTVGAIAVLRLDGDWYESTKVPLDHLYDQVSSGGFVIIDDYGTCYGARKAVDEFRTERRLSLNLHSDGRGGAWFQKP